MARVGELLAVEGASYAIVVLGGAALNLLGIIERPTTDVDILAFAHPEFAPREISEPPEPMPEPLRLAALAVARDMGLDERWLNVGPSLQWRAGLPPGLATRVHWRLYDALNVGLVDRYDLIFFKLFAATDSPGPESVHYRDLLALAPTAAELEAADGWVQTQDASPEFGEILRRVVIHVGRDLGFDTASDARRDR
ncbi:MAG: hypothetical protein ACR2GJ_09235 [Gemmatimonadaceae bacterium]